MATTEKGGREQAASSRRKRVSFPKTRRWRVLSSRRRRCHSLGVVLPQLFAKEPSAAVRPRDPRGRTGDAEVDMTPHEPA